MVQTDGRSGYRADIRSLDYGNFSADGPHFLRFEAKRSARVERRYYATDNPRKGEMDK